MIKMHENKLKSIIFPTATLCFFTALIYFIVFWTSDIMWLKPFNGVFHIISFFILTILMLETAKRMENLGSLGKNEAGIWKVAFIVFCVAFISEVLQYPTQRDSDAGDLLLNTLGILAATLLFRKRRLSC